jgi:hypothetical protein
MGQLESTRSIKQLSSGSTSDPGLPTEAQQILVLLKLLVSFSGKTVLRDLDISLNIVHQTFQTKVVIFRSDEAQYHQIHMTVVEVVFEAVHDVHLDTAHGVLVERIPADTHHHREDGRPVAGSKGRRETSPAVVDTGLDILVSTDRKTGNRNVGCWYPELRVIEIVSVILRL